MPNYNVLTYMSAFVLDDPFDEIVVKTAVVSGLLDNVETIATVDDFFVSS